MKSNFIDGAMALHHEQQVAEQVLLCETLHNTVLIVHAVAYSSWLPIGIY